MIFKNYFLIFVSCAILISSEEIEEEKSLSRQKRKLLFPQFTTLQLSMALVSQVSHITSHKFALNTGFQMNYQLPFQPSSFYHPMFWSRSGSEDTSIFSKFFNRIIESNDDGEDEEIQTTTDVACDPEEITERTKRDLTAGEFYHGIKESLSMAGYHEDCLLKSICELAKQPLVEDKEDLMGELLHFILTPSVHQGFDAENESKEQKAFEDAEKFGKIGGDCDLMYDNCERTPLHKISNFMSDEDE